MRLRMEESGYIKRIKKIEKRLSGYEEIAKEEEVIRLINNE